MTKELKVSDQARPYTDSEIAKKRQITGGYGPTRWLATLDKAESDLDAAQSEIAGLFTHEYVERRRVQRDDAIARAERAEQDLKDAWGLMLRGAWRREGRWTYLSVRVEDGADLSCRATREDAINAAIKKHSEGVGSTDPKRGADGCSATPSLTHGPARHQGAAALKNDENRNRSRIFLTSVVSLRSCPPSHNSRRWRTERHGHHDENRRTPSHLQHSR